MMCGLCFCTSLFSVRIKITFLFCSIYLKRMENMNKETGTKSMYCFDSGSVWKKKIEKLVTADITRYFG